MKTIIYNETTIDKAADLLKNGELVAFPTETVYGLGAIASNEEAVKNVYAVKGRPNDNPLIVHVANKEIEKFVAAVPENARLLMDAFWPGPLTLIFPMKAGVFAPAVTTGHQTVALRMPENKLTLRLIEKTGFPLVGPSANTSGKPSPTTADHVLHDLDCKIAGILDGGTTDIGLESTVVDLTDPEGIAILRPGAVTEADIEKIVGKPASLRQKNLGKAAPKAPGMKYQHYAPSQPVTIVSENIEDWGKLIKNLQKEKRSFGILAGDKIISSINKDLENGAGIITYSLGKDASSASKKLYAGLRFLDEQPVQLILAQEFPKNGIGLAYMNRLEKAAANKYKNGSFETFFK